MPVTASFSPTPGVVTLLGDDDGNVLTSSRNAAGAILINGGTIAIQGGLPTVANTILIEAVGRGGNDTLALDEASGALPRASFTGGAGNDVLRGGSGDDLLYGGDDHDLLQGKGGADVLVGGAGNDQLEGGAGDDQMSGGVGDDTLLGGAGNDYISWNAGDGSDVVEGGDGFDTLDFSGSISGDLIAITASGARVDVGLNISIPLDLDDVERIRVRSLNGPDNIYVGDLSGTDVTQVAIDLAGTPGGSAGDGLVDMVDVQGTAGGDNISFALAGTVVTINGLPAQVTIDHADATDQLRVNGLAGNDRIDASALTATSLRLTIDGGTGNDTLFGGAGNDILYGGDDNDIVVGRGGVDWADLGLGDDRFVWTPGDGSDTVFGGTGEDTLQFVGSNADERIDVSTNGQNVGPLLRVFRNVDGATTTAGGIERIEVDALGGADIITVNDLEGTSAMEVVVDLAGTPNGTAGDGQRDRVNVNGETGSGGNAIAVEFNNGAVQVLGLNAIVTIEHADAEDELRITTFGAADLIGASGLAAGHIRLSLFGGAGNDMLYGSQGDDTLEGGAGADQLIGGAGIDTASYAASSAGVSIILASTAGQVGGDAEGDTLFEIENVTGSAHDDYIDGNALANVLTGGAGNDQLTGAGGDDTLEGGAGNDVVIGGAGTDTAIFTGNRANYLLNLTADGIEVVDQRPGRPFGTDAVIEVERLVFSDGAFAPVAPLGDVVWRHSEGSIATANGHLGVVGTTWQTRGTGDFDGDGDGDVLWRHDDGQTVIWEMEGGNYLVNHNLGVVGATWQIAGTGDFDGDGDADILWRHNDGMVVSWEMEDGELVTNHNLPQVSTSFQIAGTGDFDGDGDADILWRGSAGQVVIWEMEDGALVTNHNLPQVSASFQIAGTGDFDGDGDADILWRGSNGAVVTWEMEDGAFVTNHNLPLVSTSFQIAGTQDFDGDGDTDILWRGSNGFVVTWEMEDGNFVTNHNFGFVAPEWQIRGTGAFDLA